MIQETNIRILPKFIEDHQEIKRSLAKQLKIPVQKIINYKILKKALMQDQKELFFN